MEKIKIEFKIEAQKGKYYLVAKIDCEDFYKNSKNEKERLEQLDKLGYKKGEFPNVMRKYVIAPYRLKDEEIGIYKFVRKLAVEVLKDFYWDYCQEKGIDFKSRKSIDLKDAYDKIDNNIFEFDLDI
jgi:hypothetical protein